MIYRLFKHYMRKLIKEYSQAYDTRAKTKQDPSMRPDFYWLDRYLKGDFDD